MSAAAIGERAHVGGFVLAGVDVREAETPEAATEALGALDPDVRLLILSPSAHRELEAALAERPELIWAVLPDGVGSTEPSRSAGAGSAGAGAGTQ